MEREREMEGEGGGFGFCVSSAGESITMVMGGRGAKGSGFRVEGLGLRCERVRV